MRSSVLLALPALCVAIEQQQPLAEKLMGWWNKATANVASSVPSIIPHPLDAGAAKVAEIAVTKINATNWKDVLTPGKPKVTGEPSEWLVYIDGGNKTCHGVCGNTTKAWNTSAAVLSALPSGPSLASIDCEQHGVLCNSWAVTPPAIYHILLNPTKDPVVRYIPLNHTKTVSATTTDIVELHTKRAFEKTEPYTGYFHPWTGLVAKSGLAVPYGYATWAIALMPGWLPMILVSVFSRTIMGRRSPQARRAPGTAPAAAPAPAARS